MLDFPNSPIVGDVFDSKWRWDGEKWISTSSVSTPYLPIAGGTMLGPITLSGWATANLHAVPLQQVVSRLQSYLPLTGGTLSGSLNVTGNVVATALVQGATVNATGDLTAGGNIGTNNVLYAGAVQSGAFYGNPTFTGSITVNGNISTSNGVYAAVVQAPVYAGSVTVTGTLQVNGNIGCNNTIFATGAVQTPQLNGNVYVTGNLNSGGQVQGDSLYARNRADVVNGVFCNGLFQSARGDDLAFYAPYGGMTIATAYVSNRGGGQLGFYAPYADASIGGTVSAGAFNTGGGLTANTVYANYVHSWGTSDASGDVNAGGSMYAGGTVNANYLYSRGTGNIAGSFGVGGNINAGGTITGGYITSTGNVNANGDLTGNGCYANYIESRGDMRAANTLISNNGIVAANDSTFGLGQSGGGRNLSFAGGWYLVWNMGNGDLSWVIPNGQVNWHMAVTGFCYANITSAGGRGEYVNFSDSRFKEGVTPTTRGLAEILQLTPVEYQFIPPPEIEPPETQSTPVLEGMDVFEPPLPPPPTQKRHLGFVAQEVAPIIPEAVNIIGVQAPDGSGGIETDDPTLGVTVGSITAVLVNAVKELNATLADMNTRLAALEGA